MKRAYSHYWHFSSGFECNATLGAPPRRAPECFHASVVAQIDALHACEAQVLRRDGARAPLNASRSDDVQVNLRRRLFWVQDSEAVHEVDQCAWGDRTSAMVCCHI